MIKLHREAAVNSDVRDIVLLRTAYFGMHTSRCWIIQIVCISQFSFSLHSATEAESNRNWIAGLSKIGERNGRWVM
ncbi:hypothetical protein QQG55_40210 [Brugia pahangi]